MTREITITVTAPVDCTDQQFKEWVMFEVGYGSSISIDNPLHEYDLEADVINFD